MKLSYYRDPKGNFGDDLNPMIWNALAPEILDNDPSTLLVGIGTLLNSRMPALPHKVIFGSGAGYVKPAVIDATWQFYCVRGPKTAEVLGIDASYAITDPAVLLTQIVTAPVEKTNAICFMPHCGSTENADWQAVCDKAGLVYLDPSADIHELIAKIRGAKLIIAEAMHGAIVADAFRVPWIPVTCYEHILGFKWDDWCQSMQLKYQPETVPSLWDVDRHLAPKELLKAKVKRGLKAVYIWKDEWTPAVPRPNVAQVEGEVIAKLSRLASSGQSFLSDDWVQQQAIERLMNKLIQLKHEWAPATGKKS